MAWAFHWVGIGSPCVICYVSGKFEAPKSCDIQTIHGNNAANLVSSVTGTYSVIFPIDPNLEF